MQVALEGLWILAGGETTGNEATNSRTRKESAVQHDHDRETTGNEATNSRTPAGVQDGTLRDEISFAVLRSRAPAGAQRQ